MLYVLMNSFSLQFVAISFSSLQKHAIRNSNRRVDCHCELKLIKHLGAGGSRLWNYLIAVALKCEHV